MSDQRIPGTDDEDAKLDAVLREYFSSRLDGQLGRSAAHFHRHLRGAGGASGASRPRGLGFSPGGGWVVGIVGSALAASIAALWAGPSLRLNTPPPPPGQLAAGASAPESSAGSDLQMEELTLCSQTRDGGTVVLDGQTAARRLIRRELRQTRWVNPRTGASLERFEPRQDIMLIKLDTY